MEGGSSQDPASPTLSPLSLVPLTFDPALLSCSWESLGPLFFLLSPAQAQQLPKLWAARPVIPIHTQVHRGPVGFWGVR